MHSSAFRASPRAMTLRHYLIAIFALLILPACKSEDRPTGESRQAAVNCSTVSAGPADLATVDTGATPRADAGAEILALEVSGEFIAPESLFQRILAELTGIRAGFPEVAQIAVRPCAEPDRVIVHFTELGTRQLQEGTYTAWDDANANLRLRDQETFPTFAPGAIVALRFEGRYNVNRLAAGYSEFPEVMFATVDGLAGDGTDICLAQREPSHFYIFRHAGGDCPSGCIEEAFLAVTVDDSGNIAKLGEWDGSGDAPQWFAEAADCRAFLPP